MRNLVCGAGAGAALLYFLDPNLGRRRRNIARDRAAAIVRRGARGVARRSRLASATLYGLEQKLTHSAAGTTAPPNDATLALKVESEVFRDPDVPKGQININAEYGTIVLRGEVRRPEQVRSIEAAVKRVPGVRSVENLLHLTGTPPRMH
jgi:osmotically-inducible protein OsmY